MNIEEIVAILKNELRREEELLDFLKMRKSKVPEGSLSTLESYSNTYYSQRVYVDGKGTSISLDPNNEEHRMVIRELMEKKTLVHGTPILKRNVKELKRCVKILRPYHPGNFLYGDKLGSEYHLAGDVCIKDWLKKPECQNPFFVEQMIHDTKRGPKVRSKSEVIISDTLFDHNILYKNETCLIINGKRFFPDIELLHPKTWELFWWEHLGKLDDPEYVFKNLEKINVDYARAGIEVGKNLILTYETKEKPLTRSTVEERLRYHRFV